MDRRRVELQLRLVIATARAERGRDRSVDVSVAERSASILDYIAIEVRPEKDPELADLLADARAAVQGLLVDTP